MFNKKLALMAVLALLVTLMASVSFAKGRYGCGDCDCYGFERNYGVSKNDSNFRKFREETFPLRQQMSEKRFELEKEYSAEKVDEAKIAKLKDDIKALRDKVYEIKKKYGISDKRFSPRCY